MSLLKTFNLNATKTLIAVCIIVALLWSVPYFLPTDPTTISANPAGWGILAVFIWGLYCAFTATEYRALRGLGMRPRQWLMSMHATLWLAAFVFGAIIRFRRHCLADILCRATRWRRHVLVVGYLSWQFRSQASLCSNRDLGKLCLWSPTYRIHRHFHRLSGQ